MRLLTLSNHAANMAEQAQQAREALDAVASAGHTVTCVRRQERLSALTDSVAASVQNWRFHLAVLAAARWLRCYMSAVPRKPEPLPISQQEMILRSGARGEEIAQEHFRSRLSDDWTAVAGYKNAKGEIDLVLVGRQGVVCLEIKYLNAVIHCVGDRWHRDKTDRFGNLIETGLPIEDSTGRSPSEQLREPCAVLREFLERKRLPFTVPIWTGVVFTHRNSRIGRVQQQTVDFIGRLEEFTADALMRLVDKSLPSVNVPVVVELLHTHHQNNSTRQLAGRGSNSRGRA